MQFNSGKKSITCNLKTGDGVALVKKLAPDYSVTVVDNLLTQRYCSLFSFNQPVKFIEGSFKDVSLDGIDTVIHLAAITDAASSFGNRKEIEKVNVRGRDPAWGPLDKVMEPNTGNGSSVIG